MPLRDDQDLVIPRPGVTVTLLLFGDAHQSLYRESEGSVMAICNARASSGGPGKGISLKVADPSSVYKLGTSADYALCGAKTKVGDSRGHPGNISSMMLYWHQA